jgi:hypothetical protein
MASEVDPLDLPGLEPPLVTQDEFEQLPASIQ